jgi:hypothetical protein
MTDNAGTTKTFVKFAASETDDNANKYGIKNGRGEIVTDAYLRRYIQCWCRSGDGFTQNRDANFAFFMSDEFLATQRGKTASQVGKAASLSELWGRTDADKAAGRSAARKSAGSPVDRVTPAMMAELMTKFELIDGVWTPKKVVVDDAELAAEVAKVAEIEIVSGPAGEPVAIAKAPKGKSKKAQAEAEMEDIVASKTDAIDALAKSLGISE